MMYLGNQPVGINKIEEKSPSWISKIKSTKDLFSNQTLSSNSITLDFEGAILTYGASNMFQAVQSLEYIILKNVTIQGSMEAFVRSCRALRRLTFENCHLAPDTMRRFLYNDWSNIGPLSIEQVDGEFDLTNCTNVDDMLSGAVNLKSIRFAENSIKQSLPSFNVSPFDDDTLVSIGNALNDSVSGKSVTFSVEKKERCSVLTGTNDSGTFILSSNGTMSLLEFITTIKGWTLA